MRSPGSRLSLPPLPALDPEGFLRLPGLLPDGRFYQAGNRRNSLESLPRRSVPE